MNPCKKHSRAVRNPATDVDTTRVLVTGASGFVGPYVMARLRNRAYHVLTVAGRELSAERVAALEPDIVIHLAAMTHPDACERAPDEAREVNVELTRRVAVGASKSCCRFVYASTDLVFDGERGHYTETDPADPICVYGATKLAGEHVARAELGERVITARLALLYGPRLERGARPSFAETMIETARAGKPVHLYVDQYRTPLFVEDAAESLVQLAAPAAAEAPALVHLGGPARCSRHEMGKAAFEVLGLPVELARASRMADHETVAQRPKDVSFECARARAFGLSARGLREGFQSFRDRMIEP